MNLSVKFPFTLILALLFLQACSSGSERENGTEQEFNTTASFGDLATYTLDPENLTYSYSIVESEFGLQGESGSGQLVVNLDGTYSPADDPEVSVVFLPGALVVAGATVEVGGTDTDAFFAGVPKIAGNYTAEQIAGVYNYITFECDMPLEDGACTAGYRTYFGTFQINADGSWAGCGSGAIDDKAGHPCEDEFSGNWEDRGNGLVKITAMGGIDMGSAMLLQSAGGGQVLVIDQKNVPLAEIGPGLIIGVHKQDISTADLGGTYHFVGNSGSYGSVTVDNAANTYTGVFNLPGQAPESMSGTLTRNHPFQGWLWDDNGTPGDDSDDSIVLILPQLGVYLVTSVTDNRWIEIGGLLN